MFEGLIIILVFSFFYLVFSYLYDKHIDKEKDDRFDDWQF